MGIITEPKFYAMKKEWQELSKLDINDPEAYQKYKLGIQRILKRLEESKKARIKESGLRVLK